MFSSMEDLFSIFFIRYSVDPGSFTGKTIFFLIVCNVPTFVIHMGTTCA